MKKTARAFRGPFKCPRCGSLNTEQNGNFDWCLDCKWSQSGAA